jgi:hypothetical protein
VRYASLQRFFPDEAAKLHEQLEKEVGERFQLYKRMENPEVVCEAPEEA